jgi:hypothetical protein
VFKRRFEAGDTVWVVKVTKTGGLIARPLCLLVIDSRRICVAREGKRVTWNPRRVRLFATPNEALRAAMKHLAQRQAKEVARRPALRAA